VPIGAPDFRLKGAFRMHSVPLVSLNDALYADMSNRVIFVGQGIKKSWAMKREILSSAYLTRVADLPVVKRAWM